MFYFFFNLEVHTRTLHLMLMTCAVCGCRTVLRCDFYAPGERDKALVGVEVQASERKDLKSIFYVQCIKNTFDGWWHCKTHTFLNCQSMLMSLGFSVDCLAGKIPLLLMPKWLKMASYLNWNVPFFAILPCLPMATYWPHLFWRGACSILLWIAL